MRRALILALLIIPYFALPQKFVNSAYIKISQGTSVTVKDMTFFNTGSGTIELDGELTVNLDFNNYAANHLFVNPDATGTVIFNGKTQVIRAQEPNYIDFDGVRVNSGTNLVLTAGSGITVNGLLTVDGTLKLRSPEDETLGGILITSENYGVAGTGTVIVERFFKTANRWQYVTVPLSGQTSDLFTENTVSGNFNPNFYTYDETYDALVDPPNTDYSNWSDPVYAFYNAWQRVQNQAGAAVELFPGTGYIYYGENNLFLSFSGAITSLYTQASYTPQVSFTLNDANSGYYDGWNLVANPYTAPIDWDNPDWQRTNIQNTVYLWDGDNGNYIYYNNGAPADQLAGNGQTLNSETSARYIAPMQAFFIKATDAAPSLTIPASARVHASTTMFKGEQANAYDYVKLQVEHDGHIDQALIRFFDGATPAFDDRYDALKAFASTAGLPQIFTYTADGGSQLPLAINSLPLTDSLQVEIPLFLAVNSEGDYTFSVEDYNLYRFSEFYLVDSSDGGTVTVDFNRTDHYTVHLNGGLVAGRFYLRLGRKNTVLSGDNAINIYAASHNLYVTIAGEELLGGTLTVYDISGRIVLREKIVSDYTVLDMRTFAQGVYVADYRCPLAGKTVKFALY